VLINPDLVTSTADKSWYETVLQEAADIIAATKISVDQGSTDQSTGKNIYIGFYWVDSETLDALNNTIAEVKTETDYLLGAGVSPSLLDHYAGIVQEAVKTFSAARVQGDHALDWPLLETTWQQVKNDYDQINLAALPAISSVLELLDYDTSGTFKTDATPAALDAFGATLAEIKEWFDAGKEAAPGTITQDEIEAKIAEVEAAPGIFTASLGKGYWATVPAGKFQRDDTSTNISEITTAYKMGVYEVTQELWLAVMDRNNSINKTGGNLQLPVDGGADGNASASNMGLPPIYVFCNTLSTLKGKAPVYSRTGGTAISTTGAYPTDASWTDITMNASANGYRLPTEMEWMWAAMGANSTASDMNGSGVNVKGYKKDFAGDSDPDTTGDSPLDYVWTATYSAGTGSSSYPAVTGNTGGTAGNNMTSYSKPGGGKLPNELGIYDMSGNLTEYCWDTVVSDSSISWPAGTLTDYANNANPSGARRVVIGGDYGGNYPVVISRARWEATLNCAYNNYAHRYYGFRIVCKAE
jgi:formylglycine-generating enzyme required for sulfatase activity